MEISVGKLFLLIKFQVIGIWFSVWMSIGMGGREIDATIDNIGVKMRSIKMNDIPDFKLIHYDFIRSSKSLRHRKSIKCGNTILP